VTHVEQKNVIRELKDYERNMSRAEQEEFTMWVKRDKDDEDLDAVTKKKLMQLYEKYIVNKPKKIVKSPFGDTIER
jgi:hypothetical protein